MSGKETETVMEIRRMSMDEKVKLLSETDKDYLRGYIDRALIELVKSKNTRKNDK